MISCRVGNENIVKELLKKGAEVNEKNNNGDTPLMISCRIGNENIVKELLKKAEVNEKNNNSNTPLHFACGCRNEGNENIVKKLLKKGAEVNEINKDGDSPLIIACKNGNESIIRYFVDNEIGIKQNDKNTLYSLFVMACFNDNKNIIKYIKSIIDENKFINEKYKDNDISLINELKNGYDNIGKYLFEHIKDSKNNESLISDFKNIVNENIIKFLYLVENKTDVNQKDFRGTTPLTYIYGEGNDYILSCLINYDPDIFKEDKNGKIPLLDTYRNFNDNLVKYLIRNGADVNQKNKDDDSPLIYLFKNGYDNLLSNCISLELLKYFEQTDECKFSSIMEYLEERKNKYYEYYDLINLFKKKNE